MELLVIPTSTKQICQDAQQSVFPAEVIRIETRAKQNYMKLAVTCAIKNLLKTVREEPVEKGQNRCLGNSLMSSLIHPPELYGRHLNQPIILT